MSQDSTQAVAANAKPAPVTNEDVARQFGEFANVARQALSVALKGGVNASAIMAVVAYKVTMFGGTKNQAHFLLFGTEKPAKHDSGEAKLWRAGWSLAGHWRFTKSLPECIAKANSEDAAFVASCGWLEENGITSLVMLETYLAKAKGITAPPKDRTATPLPERFGNSIAKAEKEETLSVVDVQRMAKLMVENMSLANARAFTEAAMLAHDTKAETVANAEAALLANAAPKVEQAA